LQHTRRCDWETFEGREEFLDEVRRKGDKFGKRMIYERKQQIHDKHLMEPPRWILATIKRVLNLSDLLVDPSLDEFHDCEDTALAYWRQNRRQYPPERVWDKFHFDLLYKSFASRHELRPWCVARVKQLKDLVCLEEQWKKVEEAERLTREAEQQRRRETPRAWEHYFAKQEEANRRARAAELGGTTSETWPPPRPEPSNFPLSFFKILQFILIVV
jgi:hypothetical protein